MTIEKLESAFNESKKLNMPICVGIKIPGQEENELIINGIGSLDNKLKYYKNNYDEKCNHKNGSGVKIVSAFPIKFYLDENDKEESEKM